MKLHEYQERAVEFCIQKEQVYLAIDLGMGKTAIALTVREKLNVPMFVLGPLRTIYSSWPEEIAKWSPGSSYKILHGETKSLYDIDQYDILLMNYEGLKWFSKQQVKWTRRMIVFDESSMVKSHSTQRFKTLNKMRPLWLKYKIAMSATPAPNKLSELWSQYSLICEVNPLGRNISEFRKKYCRSFSYPGMSVTLYEVMEDKKNEIYSKIAPITYRLQASDYLTLPPITYNEIACTMPPDVAKKYKAFENEFFIELDQGGIEAKNTATLGMKLRQFVQGGLYNEEKQWIQIHDLKLNALQELVETSTKPILCSIQFRGELESIKTKLGKNIPVIAGGTSAKDAQNYIKQWNLGRIPLLLCHPASLSHGLNLQAGGSILVWYGLTWSLEQYLQLVGRLHRQGQRNAVYIHHIILSGTIDSVIIKAIQSKNSTQTELLQYLKEYREKRKKL